MKFDKIIKETSKIIDEYLDKYYRLEIKEPLQTDTILDLKKLSKNVIKEMLLDDEKLTNLISSNNLEFKDSLSSYNKKIKEANKELIEKLDEIEKVHNHLIEDLKENIEKNKEENKNKEIEHQMDVEYYIASSNQNLEIIKNENDYSNNRFDYQYASAKDSYSQSIEKNNLTLERQIENEKNRYLNKLEDFDVETDNIVKKYKNQVKENEKELDIYLNEYNDMDKFYSNKRKDESTKLNNEIRTHVKKRTDEIAIARQKYNNSQINSQKERDNKNTIYQAESQKITRDFVTSVNYLEEDENAIKTKFDKELTLEKQKTTYALFKIHQAQEKELKELYENNTRFLVTKAKAYKINRSYYKMMRQKEKDSNKIVNNMTIDYTKEIEKNNYQKRILDIGRSTSFNVLNEKEVRDNKFYQEQNNLFENTLNFDIYEANLEFNKRANDVRLISDIKGLELEKGYTEDEAKCQIKIETINSKIKKKNLEITLALDMQKLVHDYEESRHNRAITYYTVSNLLEIEKYKVLNQFNKRQHDLNIKNANAILDYSNKKIELQNKKFETFHKEEVKIEKRYLDKLINEHNYKIIEHELNLAKEQNVTRRNSVFKNDVIIHNALSERFNTEIKNFNYLLSTFSSLSDKIQYFISRFVANNIEDLVGYVNNDAFINKYFNEIFKLMISFYTSTLDTYIACVNEIIDERLKFEEDFKFKKIFDETMNTFKTEKKAIESQISEYNKKINLLESVIEDIRKSIFNLEYEEDQEKKKARIIGYNNEYREKINALNKDISTNENLILVQKKNINKLELDILSLVNSNNETINDLKEIQHDNASAYYNFKNNLKNIHKEVDLSLSEISKNYYKLNNISFNISRLNNYVDTLTDIFNQTKDKMYSSMYKFYTEANRNNYITMDKINSQYEKDIKRINGNYSNKLSEENEKFQEKDHQYDLDIENLKKEENEYNLDYDNLIEDNEKVQHNTIDMIIEDRKKITDLFYSELYAVSGNFSDIENEYNIFVKDADLKFEKDKAELISKIDSESQAIDLELNKYISDKKDLINHLPQAVKEQIKEYNEDNKIKGKKLLDDLQIEKENYVLRTKDYQKLLSEIDSTYNEAIVRINSNEKRLKVKEKRDFSNTISKLKKQSL